MTSYTEWWDGLSVPLKLYWGLAIPFTLFFLLQLALSFFGGDHASDDVSKHKSSHPPAFKSQFFTLRNFITFFSAFAWVGIASTNAGFSEIVSVLIALVTGIAMMTLMAFIFYSLSKSRGGNTLKISSALGGIGQVCVPIRKQRNGVGQVQIKIQGSLRTLDAQTDDHDDIPAGKMVTIKSIVNDSILLVTAK